MTQTATYEVLNIEGGFIYESEDWTLANDVAAQVEGAYVVRVPDHSTEDQLEYAEFCQGVQ